MDDLLPPEQIAKLAVLDEIRALLDDPKLAATLSAKDKDDLDRLRPPNGLLAIGDSDVPRDLAWPFIEKNGSMGRLIVVRGAKRFNSFDVDDRLAFAAEARAVELPPAAAIAGEPLIVADIIETMERDAPNMTMFAIAGSILAVFLVIGLRRHGLVTLACGLAGVVVMIAACALAGLRVHFLDLIALPITVGIGIDYAVNLAARDRQDGHLGPHHLLRTTGGSVLLCSYTTAVGYGTLMLSANGGIKAFGLAALLGEIACVTIAVMVTPTWLAILRRRDGAAKPGEILP
jgi:predicted RND superfamily exporter protein